MKLDGRRESTNVEDRRSSAGKVAGIAGGAGLIGLIITLVMQFMGGGGSGIGGSVIEEALPEVLGSVLGGQTETVGEASFSEEEQELASFSKKILASTEDVWTKVFRQMGKTYQPPTLVLYTGSTSTRCGQGQAAMGPFYCSADQKLYIDLSFFSTMKQQLGADGDFAYAYVIAHEVGHHVEYLMGDLAREHNRMSQMSKKDANARSVRIELQADFYAGIWGYYEKQLFGSLEDGDLEEAIRCASVIGDDYLQKKAQGFAVEDSFTHGTAAQRMRWLKKGLTTGDMSKRDTYNIPANQL